MTTGAVMKADRSRLSRHRQDFVTGGHASSSLIRTLAGRGVRLNAAFRRLFTLSRSALASTRAKNSSMLPENFLLAITPPKAPCAGWRGCGYVRSTDSRRGAGSSVRRGSECRRARFRPCSGGRPGLGRGSCAGACGGVCGSFDGPGVIVDVRLAAHADGLVPAVFIAHHHCGPITANDPIVRALGILAPRPYGGRFLSVVGFNHLAVIRAAA